MARTEISGVQWCLHLGPNVHPYFNTHSIPSDIKRRYSELLRWVGMCPCLHGEYRFFPPRSAIRKPVDRLPRGQGICVPHQDGLLYLSPTVNKFVTRSCNICARRIRGCCTWPKATVQIWGEFCQYCPVSELVCSASLPDICRVASFGGGSSEYY